MDNRWDQTQQSEVGPILYHHSLQIAPAHVEGDTEESMPAEEHLKASTLYDDGMQRIVDRRNLVGRCIYECHSVADAALLMERDSLTDPVLKALVDPLVKRIMGDFDLACRTKFQSVYLFNLQWATDMTYNT